MNIDTTYLSDSSETRGEVNFNLLTKKSCLQCGRPWNGNTPITVMPADGEHVWWHTVGICKYRRR